MNKDYNDYFKDQFQDDLKHGLKFFHTSKGHYQFLDSSIYNTKRMYLQHCCQFKDLKTGKILWSTYGEVLEMIIKSKQLEQNGKL